MGDIHLPAFFELQSKLGEGGFGALFAVTDLRGDKHEGRKALKIVPFTHASSRAAFRREARALRRLEHPAIVRISDAFEEADHGILVMELLNGRTLATALTEGHLSIAHALEIALHVADALAHAHGRGVVHGDLSPRNVYLCDPDQTAKVIDFGLSRLFDEAADTANPRTEAGDLRSLGKILLQMLAADSLVDTPLAVRPILSALLAEDPAQRYQSASGLMLDLQSALLGTTASIFHATHRQLPSLGRQIDFVGRKNEWLRLLHAFEEAREGRGRALCWHAPSGAGKSALVRHFIDSVADVAPLTLCIQATEGEKHRSYAVARRALGELAPTLDTQAMFVSEGNAQDPSNAYASWSVTQQLVARFASLGQPGAPAIIWIDDAQWLDASSLQWLRGLLAAIAATPTLLLITARDWSEMPSELEPLTLPPLSASDLTALLGQVFGQSTDLASMGEFVAAHSEGNAFSAWELVRQLMKEGALTFVDPQSGPSWHEALAQRALSAWSPAMQLTERIRALTPATRRVLTESAVTGLPIVDLRADEARVLTSEGFIEYAASGLRFVHDRVRDAVYLSADAQERQAIHLRFAERVVATQPDMAWQHFAHAGHYEEALPALLQAIALAEQQAAADLGLGLIDHLMRWDSVGHVTLSAATRAVILFKRGTLAMRAGRSKLLLESFDAWREQERALGIVPDPAQQAAAHGRQAEAYCRLGQHEAGLAEHERALAALGLHIPKSRVALACGLLWQALASFASVWATPSHDPLIKQRVFELSAMAITLYYHDSLRCMYVHLLALRTAKRLAPCRERVMIEAQHATLGLQVPMWRSRFRSAGVQAVRMAQTLGDRWAEMYARTFALIGSYAACDLDAVQDEIPHIEAMAATVRDPTLLGMARQHHGYSLFIRGRLPEAIEATRSLRSFYERLDDPLGAVGASFYLPAMLAERARSDATEEATWMRETAASVNIVQAELQSLSQAAYAATMVGDGASAEAMCEQALTLAWTKQMYNIHTAALGGLGRLVLKRWRGVSAAFVVGMIMGRHFRAFNAWAWAESVKSAVLKRWLLRRGIASAKRYGCVLDQARCESSLGLLMLKRDPESAAGLGHIMHALEIAEPLGAARLCLGIEHALRSLGKGGLLRRRYAAQDSADLSTSSRPR